MHHNRNPSSVVARWHIASAKVFCFFGSLCDIVSEAVGTEGGCTKVLVSEVAMSCGFGRQWEDCERLGMRVLLLQRLFVMSAGLLS